MHQATDKNRSVKTLSYKQLKHEFDVASLLFSGRETDSNWGTRQAFFAKTKAFLSSDDAKTYKKELIDKIHEVIPGVYKTIKSIRTTLIEEALSLVEAIGTYVGDSINMHTNEAILLFLMNESSVTKKATALRAFEATNNYLTRIRFRPKVLTILCTKAQEKNPQLREFALGYIKTVLSVHGPANKSKFIEHASLAQAVADTLQKGLVDAAPTVRSACKETYYVFEEQLPTAAYNLASKLDITIQRRLGINITQLSSTTSKPAKPLLHRTSKSTASTIKKPTSSMRINRAAKSNIKAAMQKPSNSTPSIASKSHTSGFNLPNHHQTMTEPAQTPSSAAMPCTEIDTALNTTPSTESSSMTSTLLSTEPGCMINTILSTKSETIMSMVPSAESDSMMNTSPSASLDNMMSTAPNTTLILEPSSSTTTDSQKVSPQENDLSASDPQALPPNSESQELSSNFNSQELSLSFHPHELPSSNSSQESTADVNPRESSSQPTETLSIAAKNLPHSVKIPSRRESGVMPSPTSPSSNEGSKSPLHLTRKTSAGSIKKPVSPHSISKTAKAIKNSRSAMSPISNTEIPARTSSVSNTTSTVTTAKQPRQLDLATRRRLGLLPARPVPKSQASHTLASNEESKSPLHLTRKTSAGSIKKPVSPHSISKTAKAIKSSCSAMSPISNTEIPARTSSVSNTTSTVTTAKQPRQVDLATRRRLGLLPAGSAPEPLKLDNLPSPSSTPSTSNKSPRPRLRKIGGLCHKYDHIKSRYKDIPKRN